MAGRYKDGYRVGDALVQIGTTLKVIGGIGGALIFFLAFALGTSGSIVSGSSAFIGGLALGAAWFVPFFLFGILVSAQGQILRAGLDSAVNTSPFLTTDEKARVIDLV